MKRPELLVPVGGREQLETAIIYGADAVFLGGEELSLRAACDGFNPEQLAQAVQDAHKAGVKVYYCLNAMPYDENINDVIQTLETLPSLQIDGLIAADPGVIYLAKKYCPSVDIHLSTQAHSVNSSAVSFWKEMGATRINLARELKQSQIEHLIKEHSDIEFEVFVHGAMCLALSGHCLMSSWINNRPANHGKCTQPCRFKYRGLSLNVEEELRQNTPVLNIESGEQFSAVWAPMDLCLIRHMDWFVQSGAHAIKIEGRTKSGGYVAHVTDVYKTALMQSVHKNEMEQEARQKTGTEIMQKNSSVPLETLLQELFYTASRPLSSGFFLPERQVEKVPQDFLSRPILARVEEQISSTAWRIHGRTPWETHKDITLLIPGMQRPTITGSKYRVENHKGERTDRMNPGMTGILHCENADLLPGMYVRG